MDFYGSLKKLTSILFKKNSQDITVRPNQATTYTAARDIQLPAGDTDHVIISASSSAVLTNKTFDADGSGNSISNIENADIKAGAAIDAAKIADGSVSSTEFQYINSLTSNAQTQLNGKVSNTGDTMTGTLNIDNASALRLSELDSNGSNYVEHKANDALASNSTYSWPIAPGVAGYVLASDTSGNLSWVNNTSATSTAVNWDLADGTTKSISHGLASLDIMVQLYNKADGATIDIDSAVRTDANTLDLTASEAPNASGWRVLIQKIG